MNTTCGRFLLCLLPTALCLLIFGCAPVKQPSATTKPAEPQLANDMQGWMRGLNDQIAALAQTSHQLPGPSDAEHRKLMSDAFGSLSQILPLLHGKAQTGQFMLQMQTLNTAQSQLAGGSSEMSIEPTIDLAIRATASALTDIQQGNPNLTDRAEISTDQTELQQWIGQLDLKSGPLHRQVEANAIDSITRTAQAMSSALAEKMNGPTTAASGQ